MNRLLLGVSLVLVVLVWPILAAVVEFFTSWRWKLTLLVSSTVLFFFEGRRWCIHYSI